MQQQCNTIVIKRKIKRRKSTVAMDTEEKQNNLFFDIFHVE